MKRYLSVIVLNIMALTLIHAQDVNYRGLDNDNRYDDIDNPYNEFDANTNTFSLRGESETIGYFLNSES